MSEAPACFRLAATDGEWRVFRRLLLSRPSEATLNWQCEFLQDLLNNGVDKDRALRLTMCTCAPAPDELDPRDLSALTHAYEQLTQLEWSAVRHGQGSGPHGSGNDGQPYAACPCCGQLKEPNGDFIDEAVGHLPNCTLLETLNELNSIGIGISSDPTSVNSSDATSNSPTPTSEED